MQGLKKLTKDISGKKVGRIKFGSLMFFNDEDEKALGFGIEKEDYDIVGFKKFINEGRFLDFNKNNEIIVGKKLKDKLGLKLGDEVTVLGDGITLGMISRLNNTSIHNTLVNIGKTLPREYIKNNKIVATVEYRSEVIK